MANKTTGMASAASEVAFHARALKAPRIPKAAAVMAARAREEGWDYQQFLAAVLAEEVTARQTHGGAARVKAARFPQVKTLDDFDFTFQRSIESTTIAHLAQLDFLHEAKTWCSSARPAPARPTCRSPLASKPPGAATEWRSPPPTTGSNAWPQPNVPASSTPSSNGSGAPRC